MLSLVRSLFGVSSLVLALGLVPHGASAQAEPVDIEARARFEAGRAALAAGRPEVALADFQRSYELSRRPELLFNIGVAAERSGRDQDALDAYERYLALTPTDEIPNREDVEGRIRVLRAGLARSPDPDPDPAPAGSPGPSAAGIGLLVAGGVVAITGAILLPLGLADRSAVQGAREPAVWAEYRDRAERAPILEGTGGAAIGVGVALAATGVVLLVADGPSADATVAVAPFGLGAQVMGRW